MNYKSMTPTRQNCSLADIKEGLIREFQKLHLESQCIMELKEIKQGLNEYVWDFDQRFKILKDRLTFEILDA